MYEIELLKFLKTSRGASVYDVMKKFSIKRTAALYRIDKLKSLGLISQFERGKQKMYLPVEGALLEEFFKTKIKELEKSLGELSGKSSRLPHKNRSGRLTLSFVNYCDMLPSYKAELAKYYDIIDFSNTRLYVTDDEFIKRARSADVVVNNAGCKITQEILKQLPRLQYIHTTTFMYRYIDLDACRKFHVSVSNIPSTYRSIAISEFILAQTFTLLRQTTEASTQVQSGVNEFVHFKGDQLRGKKAILFGTAPGTRELIELLRGIGIEIAVYAGNTHEDPALFGLNHFATREEVYDTGDIFYVPWTGDDEVPLAGKLDSAFLKNIKRPVYIVSVYKHKVIDFKLLRHLVYAGLIKGIALDYFPNISSIDTRMTDAADLMYLPNVIITPDIAWYTNESIINMNKHTVERLIAYAKGKNDYLLV